MSIVDPISSGRGRRETKTLVSRLRAGAAPLITLLFPRRCLGCRVSLKGESSDELCPDCARSMRRITAQRCPRCGEQIGPHSPTDTRCPSCRDMPLVFTRATAPCKHDGAARQMVLGLKYGRRMSVLRRLATLMIEDLGQAGFMDQVDVIVPVPLHIRQRWRRGFNQAELLAKRIGKRFSVPVCTGALRRIRDTGSQARLTRAARLRNLKDAFQVTDGEVFQEKTILLCDDVLTTGATATECSRALKRAGAKRIYVSVATR